MAKQSNNLMTEMTTRSATYSYGLVFISSISFRTKKVHKKSNELIAIPELIELLEIAGSVKTIEARLLSKRHNISDYQEKRRLCFSFKRESQTPLSSCERVV